MAANQNFTVKWTLDEANSVRRAVERQLAGLMNEIMDLDAIAPTSVTTADRELLEQARQEAGRLDTILRRDL